MDEIYWEEVKWITELARIKSVQDMIPKEATENQRKSWGPRLNEEHFSILEQCLRLDFTIQEACDAAWISPSAYYSHYGKDEDFALRMDRARNFPKMAARTAVMKRIRQWDAKTALRFLELRDKNRYNTMPWIDEEWEKIEAERVQFISIPSTEWADQWKNDSQTSTNASSVSPTSANSWGKQTPWENEEEALKRLDSLSFSNE